MDDSRQQEQELCGMEGMFSMTDPKIPLFSVHRGPQAFVAIQMVHSHIVEFRLTY